MAGIANEPNLRVDDSGSATLSLERRVLVRGSTWVCERAKGEVGFLVLGRSGPGSIAGYTARDLARCGSETKRNPRLRFGLVWSPGRVCDVSSELPRD